MEQGRGLKPCILHDTDFLHVGHFNILQGEIK